MATEKKDRPWDGRSRPVNNKYRKNFNRIFGNNSKDDVTHDHVNKDHANKKVNNDERK